MCVISMVMDNFEDRFNRKPYGMLPSTQPVVISPPELAELRELIAQFKEAVQAAKTVDRLTGQPDCVDPKKAKLEERVAELERRLDAMAKCAGGG
jgi:hypothetical protein